MAKEQLAAFLFTALLASASLLASGASTATTSHIDGPVQLAMTDTLARFIASEAYTDITK